MSHRSPRPSLCTLSVEGIGRRKQHSGTDLELFPQWDWLEVPVEHEIHSAAIRDAFFSPQGPEVWGVDLPAGVHFFLETYRHGEGSAVPAPRSRSRDPREDPVEEWPYLDQDVLVPTRSRRVCMTCHWFRHHAGPNCIPLLTCQSYQGLLAQGEHLTSRCQGWTDDMSRQRGWAPEVA